MLSQIKHQDWILNGAIFALMALGLIMSLSVSSALFTQQLLWVAFGILVIFIFSSVDWRALVTYRWVILGAYVGALLLLVLVYFFAPVIRHTRSWLVIGPVQFQVSELVKVVMIIFFAYYFSKRHIGIAHVGNIVRSFIYLLLPSIFIFLQPDLGTLLVLIGLWIGFLMVSGLRWKHLSIGLLIVLVIAVFGWSHILKDYQRQRVIGLFNPNYDPLGVNYQSIQSKIAIGSSGWFGKGFQQGTQVQLGFLSEAATDFVFASFTEEWGLVGGLVVVALFLIMIFRIIIIGMRADDNFARFICLGTSIMLLIQFIMNVGTAIGFVPVVGLTFPFFSYGGSSLLANSLLMGIVQSTKVHRLLT